MPPKPTIFLGSSKEAEDLTRQLATKLQASRRVNVLPWYKAFDAGFGALEELARRLSEVDFAAFFLMPEDQVKIRDHTRGVPRDNVIFELGLFMGKLDRERTFALVEEPTADANAVKLPSDFSGVTQVRYRSSDMTALARRLLNDIKRLGPLTRIPVGTHVVGGAEGRNTHSTIASALESARPGDVILVRPGVYTEPLVIDKPVELIGVGVMDAETDQAIVRTHNATAITYTAAAGHGRIATISIEGAGEGMSGLDSVAGRLTVRGCTISGGASLEACVRVRGHAIVTLHANVVEDSDGAGVLVCENGEAYVYANRIVRHKHSCVELRDGTKARIRANRISEGKSGGIWIHGGGRAEIEHNEIFGQAFAGITVGEQAAPVIRSNKIYKCQGPGIHIVDGGSGTIADNDISANSGTGIEVASGGEPLIEKNRLYDGLGGGLLFADGGRGRVSENHVRANTRAGVAFLSGAGPVSFQGNTVMDGRAEGVYDEIGVEQEGNHVYRNAGGEWLDGPVED
jgi:parallel beta-helix repeat protein